MGNSCYAFANNACGGCDNKGAFCAYYGSSGTPPTYDAATGARTANGDCTATGCVPECQNGLWLSFIAGIVVACVCFCVTVAMCVWFCMIPDKKEPKAKKIFIVLTIFMNIFTSSFVMAIFMVAEADKVSEGQCAYNEYDIVISWVVWAISTAFFTMLGVFCIIHCYDTHEDKKRKPSGEASSLKEDLPDIQE